MRNYFHIFLLILSMLYSAANSFATEYPFPKCEYKVSPSTYDFKRLSNQITSGASTKLDKARKIQEWISRTFKYDDSKTIRTADLAMKHHRGVCQAICEVFYHLATAQGIETRIVCGISSDHTHEGHTWIIVRDNKNRSVLIEPTHALSDGSSKLSKLFFDVDPRIFILTHYPQFIEDQLLQMPLTFDDYMELQKHESATRNFGLFLYGINDKVYDKISRRQYDFPKFTTSTAYGITFKNIPLEQELEIGKEYRITASVKDKNATLCALLDGGNVKHSVKSLPNGDIELKFTPLCGKPILVCYEEGNMYAQIVKYNVKTPTKEQEEVIERTMPYYSECLATKSMIDTLALKNHGIDSAKMLELCKQGKLGEEMPKFFEANTPEYTIKDIPMDRKLLKGKPYTFHLIVPPNKEMYLRDMNGKEYKNWIILPDGSQTITVSPSVKGTFYVMQKISDNHITSVIAYSVE